MNKEVEMKSDFNKNRNYKLFLCEIWQENIQWITTYNFGVKNCNIWNGRN